VKNLVDIDKNVELTSPSTYVSINLLIYGMLSLRPITVTLCRPAMEVQCTWQEARDV